MEEHLSILSHNRALYSRFLNHFSLEQLNTIPKGFNNNIIWNVAHALVTQQLIMYGMSGVTPLVPKEWIDAYKKGTKPEGDVTHEHVDQIDKALFSSLDQLKDDLGSNLFKNFQLYTTSSKMELKSIETAFPFILFHDGIHIGSVLALAKLV
tara:strand:+ start:1007 stop:1462 length:456 start_codon:yes stop_codon:yes gene_type:complete